MKNDNKYNYPDKGTHKLVQDYIRELPDLHGKTVLDIPCGDGRASYEFIKKGASVKAFDLFPSFMKLDDIEAEYADLAEDLPLEGDSVDYIICQEGIEHIPNQLQMLSEFNRVLKKGGILLVTTPSNSHVRARLANFFLESDYWKRMPPTEIDGVWFAENSSEKLYFGHLFLLGVQHFQSLLTFSGFKTNKRIRTNIGNTSLILGVLLYPLFVFVTIYSYLSYRSKNKHIDLDERREILMDRVKLNLHPTTLFCKHIFWIIQKENNLDEVVESLKAMQRN